MSCPWEQLHSNDLGSCWIIARWHQWSRIRLPMQKMQEIRVQSLSREDDPGGGRGNPLQCSCLENPHGQRSLVGCSP